MVYYAVGPIEDVGVSRLLRSLEEEREKLPKVVRL
jgi:hypothetical protein